MLSICTAAYNHAQRARVGRARFLEEAGTGALSPLLGLDGEQRVAPALGFSRHTPDHFTPWVPSQVLCPLSIELNVEGFSCVTHPTIFTPHPAVFTPRVSRAWVRGFHERWDGHDRDFCCLAWLGWNLFSV